LTETVLLGTLVVLLGGLMEGSFALPLKYSSRWSWENSWSVYSVVGLIVIPWIAAFTTVPALLAVFRSVPPDRLLLLIAFGFGWGVANVLFGIAVQLVGMAISFAIVVGMSAGLGSLIPFLVLAPERIGQTSGHLVLGGIALALLGVALLGVAGRRRETSATAKGVSGGNNHSATVKGISLCLLAGLLAPMLNFSFAFGSDVVASAIRHGARPAGASNAVWALALLGGFISNGGYCVFKLTRNKTWSEFRRQGTQNHWLLGALMGVLWTGGILLYGWGATLMGDLGSVIGWPAFQATMIVISSVWGGLYGEWRNSDRLALRFNYIALGTLVVAICILSVGNRG
jgi:L-rhamnose-H+ transport protein